MWDDGDGLDPGSGSVGQAHRQPRLERLYPGLRGDDQGADQMLWMLQSTPHLYILVLLTQDPVCPVCVALPKISMVPLNETAFPQAPYQKVGISSRNRPCSSTPQRLPPKTPSSNVWGQS